MKYETRDAPCLALIFDSKIATTELAIKRWFVQALKSRTGIGKELKPGSEQQQKMEVGGFADKKV